MTKTLRHVGRTMHCHICDGTRIFYKIGPQVLPNGRFMLWNCNECGGTVALKQTERQVLDTAERAYAAYTAHYDGSYSPPPQSAIDAAHAVWDEVEADYEATIADFEAGTGRR